MKIDRRGIVVLVLVLGSLAGIAIWKLGGSSSTDDKVVEVGSGSAQRPDLRGRLDNRRSGEADFSRVMIDDDPKGALRLEGQVIDADDKPVGGVTVVLSANPPRTLVTEEDGGFAFDGLVGRPYTLIARSEKGVSGPITARLTAKSDPIILKLRPGAKLTVSVTAAGKPVDATVELRGEDQQKLETKDGVAVFSPVVPGGYQLAAWAPGMARTFQWVQVAGTAEAKIALVPGAAVSGRVIDAGGNGVVGARVRSSGASDWSQQGSDRIDAVITVADGRFELPALPAGSFRFIATHEEHAPATSELVTLDGKTAYTTLTIQLSAGASIAGKVIDAAGKPIASARIRIGVASNPRAMLSESPRQAYSDGTGGFAIKGLPKKPLLAIALHESGASQAVAVDTTGGDVSGVTLTLDITGTISGVVVDPAGQPMEGVQVTAGPSFADNRTPMDFSQWRLRGSPQELTDGSGKFSLSGLAPGAYTISASSTARRGRRGPGVGDGITAKTGDTNVKLVLSPEGSVKGKVTFADGTAPPIYSVSVGMVGQSFSEGDFVLEGLPPQKYEVTVRGPSFQTRVMPVTVESGKAADLGTITVAKGRSIGGLVLADGKPVPGAQIHIGRMVFGNGTSSNAQFGPMGQGTKHDTTDASGAFVLSGFPAGDITIVAEHETIGRSKALRLPTGMSGQTELTLTLEKFGVLTGVLRQGGKPIESIFVSCQSTTTPGALYSVASGPDGSYRFDRLAPDVYKVSATVGMPMIGMKFYSKQIAVPSGGQVALDLVVEPGTITLDATISATNGKLGVAQVTLTSGAIAATTYNELSLKLAAAGQGASQLTIIRNGEPARLSEIAPGAYSLCIVPYPSEVKGMAAMGYIERHGDSLLAFCKPINVTPSPTTQTIQISVELPPFEGDPAPPGGGSGSGART